MKIKEKLDSMNDNCKKAFLGIQDNAKLQLQAEEKHLQELEAEIDKKAAIYDKAKVGLETMGEDVTAEYKDSHDKLGKELEALQKEYAMSQEIIEYIKHNFEL